jgi:hypothetical protein
VRGAEEARVGSHWRKLGGAAAARHGAGVGRRLAGRRRRQQGFQVGERTGEATGIKSLRWSYRSPQGGAENPLAGAGDGQERPGASGAAAGAWWSREGREVRAVIMYGCR